MSMFGVGEGSLVFGDGLMADAMKVPGMPDGAKPKRMRRRCQSPNTLALRKQRRYD